MSEEPKDGQLFQPLGKRDTSGDSIDKYLERMVGIHRHVPHTLRRRFLAAIQTKASEVLDDLECNVLPYYPGKLTSQERFDLEIGLHNYDEAREFSELGLLSDYGEKLISWLFDYNLLANWLLDVAKETLKSWSQGDIHRTSYEKLDEQDVHLTKVKKLTWSYSVAQPSDFTRKLTLTYDPFIEKHTDAKERMVQAISKFLDDVEREAAGKGGKSVPNKRDDKHFEMAALYQIKGEAYSTIADYYNIKDDKTVRDFVNQILSLLDIDKRAPKRGGNRKA